MTNKELYERFSELNNEGLNVFDRKCKLKKMEEEYKETEFSISFPDVDIMKAYELFYEDVTSIGNLFNNLMNKAEILVSELSGKIDNEFLSNFDPETLDVFKQLAKEYLVK